MDQEKNTYTRMKKKFNQGIGIAKEQEGVAGVVMCTTRLSIP